MQLESPKVLEWPCDDSIKNFAFFCNSTEMIVWLKIVGIVILKCLEDFVHEKNLNLFLYMFMDYGNSGKKQKKKTH